MSGVKKYFTTHRLGHAFGSLLVIGGTDIVSVKEMMRYSRIETTIIYMQTTPNQYLWHIVVIYWEGK